MAEPPLSRYRARRDFARTTEPHGDGPGTGGRLFVVHKHHATADHYDLRLQVGDVLRCWAVPRGPSLDPADRRLAVETEDHPLAYADFEGVIPKGQYGGGPMILWDRGTWAPMGDAEADLARGAFKFRLAGEKLAGGWMLTRLKPREGEGKTSWLLIKERDAAAAPGRDILAERPESVKSGLEIEALEPAAPPARRGALRPGRLPGAVRGDLPARLAPQLATAVPEPPEGPDWLHEIKYDGYRTLAHVADGAARLITRNGLDWTGRYGALARALAALPCRSALVDGEVVVLDAKGVSHFAALQDALSRGDDGAMAFFAFDLVHLDGWNLADVPLLRRKETLGRLLAAAAPGGRLQFSDHVAGSGADFFARVSDLGLEGVVSKRAVAPYRPGRSRAWTKTKARRVGDFVIAGYTTSAAAGGLAALALAEWDEGALVWRGKVGTGFDAATLLDLEARLEPLRDPDAVPPEGAPRGVQWVRPVLTAHVHYATLTADGALRHGVFRGLRGPAPAPEAAAPPRQRLISEADLAGITITNPTRRMFGRSGATKLDVAVYYAAIGDAMLPHLTGRPVSLVRCPSGRPEDCFFQRHAFSGMPASVATVAAPKADGESRRYLAVTDAKGFLALAQFGVVEFHTWGSRIDRIDRPDRIVFDLDPGEGIAWRDIVAAAERVREALAERGLVPFVKTTGGKGLHVVVPVTRRRTWDAIHAASREIATAIAAEDPDAFTTTMGASNRRNRIFIDFHRNARSATAVAAYSLRARPHLPASAPVAWEDLRAIDAPADLNYSSLPGLVSASGDAWAGIAASARNLTGRP